MEYKLVGDIMQALQITLGQGEEVFAEAGAMLYMGPGIDLQAELVFVRHRQHRSLDRVHEALRRRAFRRRSDSSCRSTQARDGCSCTPGKPIRVDTGCIVSMVDTVSYDIQFAGGVIGDLIAGD